MKAKYHLVIFGWPEISLILVVMKQLGIGNCNSPADATWLLWMVSLQSLHPTSPFTGTAMHPGSYIPSLDTLGQLYSFAIMYDRPLRIRACATSLLLFKQVTRLQIYIWALLASWLSLLLLKPPLLHLLIPFMQIMCMQSQILYGSIDIAPDLDIYQTKSIVRGAATLNLISNQTQSVAKPFGVPELNGSLDCHFVFHKCDFRSWGLNLLYIGWKFSL